MKILPTLPEGNNPCLNCTKRKLGCHSKCKDYQIFKEKVAELRKKQRYQFTGRSVYEVKDKLKFNKTTGKRNSKYN